MATGPLKLQIVINADGSAAVTNIEKVSGATKKLGGEAKTTGGAIGELSGRFAGLFTGATLAAAVTYSRQIALISDEINALTIRMTRMGGEGGFVKLTDLANTLGVSWKDAAEQVQGFVPAMSKLGKGFDDAVAFALDFNKSMRVFGVDATTAARVAIQLTQAMAGSVAQWEEIKSIQESATGVAAALEQILQRMLKLDGVSLKEMSAQMALTPKVLEQAFGELFKSLEKDFAGLPDMLSQQEARMVSAWERMLAAMGKKTQNSEVWKVLSGGATAWMEDETVALGGLPASRVGLEQERWRAERLVAERKQALADRQVIPSTRDLGDIVFGDLFKPSLDSLNKDLAEAETRLAKVNAQLDLLNTPSAAPAGKLGSAREQIAALQRDAERAAELPSNIMDTYWALETRRGTDPKQPNYAYDATHTAHGPMQITNTNLRLFRQPDTLEGQIQASASLIKANLAQTGGDEALAAGLYVSGHMDPAKWNAEQRKYVADYMAARQEAQKTLAMTDEKAAKAYGASERERIKATKEAEATIAQYRAEGHGRIAQINAAAQAETAKTNENLKLDERTRADLLVAIESKRAEDVLAVRRDIDAKTLDLTKATLTEEQRLRVEAAQAIAQIEADKDLTLDDRAARINAVNAALEQGLAKLNGTAALTGDQLRMLGERYGTSGAAAAWYANELRMLQEYQERVPMSSDEHAEALRRIQIAYGKVAGPMAGYVASLREQSSLEGATTDLMEGFRRNLVDGLADGKLAFDDFADYAKRRLLELAVNTIFINVVGKVSTQAETAAGLTGTTGTTGTTGGTSSVSGLGSLSSFFGGNSMGGTAASYIAKGYGTVFGAGSQAFGSGIANLAGTSNLALGGGALAGGLLGNALFGKKGYGSIGSSVGSTAGAVIGSMILPGIGTIIGGLLGGAGGGFLGSLFGGGKSKQQKEQERAAIQQANRDREAAGAAAASAYANQAEAYRDAVTTAQSAADGMGLVAAATRELIKAQDAMQNDSSSAAGLEQVARARAAAEEALKRELATQQSVRDVLPGLMADLSAAGMSLGANAEDAARSLGILAGGIGNLQAAQDNFRAKFASPGEQQGVAQARVTESFRALGVKEPTTRAEFAALVRSQDLSTEGGRRLYLSLLGMTDAMDEWFTTLGEVSDNLDNLGGTIREWINKTRESIQSRLPGDARLTYESTLAKAGAGDSSAWAGLTQAADRYLETARANSRSREEYRAVVLRVTGEIERAYAAEAKRVADEAARVALIERQRQEAAAAAAASIADAAASSAAAAASSAEAAGLAGFAWDAWRQAMLDRFGAGGEATFGYADGGIATGPTSGYKATLHGTEAVIPLKGGAIPVVMHHSYADLIAAVKALGGAFSRASAEQIKALTPVMGAGKAPKESAAVQLALDLRQTIKADASAGNRAAAAGLTPMTTGDGKDEPSQRIASEIKRWITDLGHKQIRPAPQFADGGIATGPESGYTALLHGREAAIPLKHGKAVPVVVNQGYTEMITEIKALSGLLRAVSVEQIKAGQKTARILQKFDIDGMPAVRT